MNRDLDVDPSSLKEEPMNVILVVLAMLGAAVVIALGIATVVSLPGMMRYMRIRRM